MSRPVEFFQLFLDSGLHHSSALFEDGTMSLDDAQRAKVDTVLGDAGLEPGMRLLDIGCGWGTTLEIAVKEHGVRATGITISPEQHAYAAARQPAGDITVRLQRWEDFHEPVDRMICVNSFENFTDKAGFLPHCRSLLPVGGRLVVLTVTADRPLFRTISREQFIERGHAAGFEVRASASLAEHYVRTLECFMGNLTDHRTEAIRIVGAEEVDRTLAFYTASAGYLRRGLNDMVKFVLTAR